MTFIEEASKEFNMEPPLCEHTIRKCIEALPRVIGMSAVAGFDNWQSRAALESLLPKSEGDKEPYIQINTPPDDAGKWKCTVRFEPSDGWVETKSWEQHGRPIWPNDPKKDRAKSLVEAWENSEAFIEYAHRRDDDCDVPFVQRHNGEVAFANWLISQNLINEKGAL